MRYRVTLYHLIHVTAFIDMVRKNTSTNLPHVLHVVDSLDLGAVENWLLRMLRHSKKCGLMLNWTFYSILQHTGELDDEARDLGAKVIRSSAPLDKKTEFVSNLRSTLRHGSYNVLHCHHDLVSAVYLLTSLGIGIDRRIVHVHNADEQVLTNNSVKRRFYRAGFRAISLMYADRIVGISNHTLDTFLGGSRRRPGRDLVHYYGVDPEPFSKLIDQRVEFRRQLGLEADTLILLFAGRLVAEKNPTFTIDVLSALHQRYGTRVCALFAGAGPEQASVCAQAQRLGLQNSIRFLGWRKDLPNVMGCCDWFILPRPERPMEGFGLAVLEAQLAGLRMLLSRGIPDDPLLPTATFRRIPLSAGPTVWARAAEEMMEADLPQQSDVIKSFQKSPFNMDTALTNLLKLHGAEWNRSL
jgi:glycosyltransferase involved in cell wall biosynthesis